MSLLTPPRHTGQCALASPPEFSGAAPFSHFPHTIGKGGTLKLPLFCRGPRAYPHGPYPNQSNLGTTIFFVSQCGLEGGLCGALGESAHRARTA